MAGSAVTSRVRVGVAALAAAWGTALSASPQSLADLLVGEYNNNEQVWQRNIDAEAPVARQHWCIERLDDGLLGVAWAPGQEASSAPAWRLRIGADRAVVVGADGADTACTFRWLAEDNGYRMALHTAADCPADLPPAWEIAPQQLVLTDHDGRAVQARRTARYTGWIVLQRRRIDPAAGEDDYIVLRDQSWHDEGFVVPIADGERSTGYAVELARLTYQNTRTAVLKLGIIDEASGETVSYGWAAPGAARIGINLRWIQAGLTRATAPAPPQPPR